MIGSYVASEATQTAAGVDDLDDLFGIVRGDPSQIQRQGTVAIVTASHGRKTPCDADWNRSIDVRAL